MVVAAVRQHRAERVAALEAEIAAVPKGSVWAESLACLTGAPGVDLVTAAWLLIGTPDFALCAGPQSLTASADLAPVPRESGGTIRGRPSIGHDGNGRRRTARYLATRSAARYTPASTMFYERLRAAGKPLKVAHCAAARKLPHLAWALGTKQQRFDPDHKQLHHGALPELAA